MLLELNNFHSSAGSEAKRIIQINDGEIGVYHHKNDTITLSVGEHQYFISNTYEFLKLSAQNDSSVAGFNDYWKVAYLMNDDGKTIRPFRPAFHNDHTPLGLQRVIDYDFMTLRWRNNPDMITTIEEMGETLHMIFAHDPHLFFSEYSEEADGDDLDRWIHRVVEDAKTRIVNEFIQSYSVLSAQNSVASANEKRKAAGHNVMLSLVEKDGQYEIQLCK